MIKVFIGTEPAQKLACEVLKHSITSRTKERIEFTELSCVELELPMQTGFSFARWAIPQICNYWDTAVYMDADIIVLDDIVKLTDNIPRKTPVIARPSEQGRFFTSVMVMDCRNLMHWNYDELVAWMQKNPKWYGAFMWATPGTIYHKDFSSMPRCWNDLDIVKSDTCLLHYTDLKRQPWRYAGHPYGKPWQEALSDAMRAGAVSDELVRQEIAAKHVRETILISP